jgi:SAM-dependent methyltransferase
MSETSATTPDTMRAVRDRYLAPSLLQPFAEDMARRLARLSIGPLLETAADTGVLTQAMASAMSAGLTIVATDPSSEMVRHASLKPGMARVTWQKADPHALPFPDATFGIVTCHFAIATLPERLRALHEARRVMKPNGRFVFSVPGNIRHNPVADCLQAALNDLFPAAPPRFIEDGLHGYADNESIDDDLTSVGFTDAIYTTVELPYAAASAHDAAIGYCLGTSLRTEIEARARGNSDPAITALTRALQKRFGNGPIETGMRAHVVSASG